jgi:TolB-like protein
MSGSRKLAAILAADVAGYSRLTGLDEEGTIKRLRQLRRELINPAVSLHQGRIVKTTGDGILIEFTSVVEAVRCALDVQHAMEGRNAIVPADRRIEFRVGINLGDVVVDGDDLLGDGVNIAARLEGIAEPGGICLSDEAYRHVHDKISAEFIDIGDQQLKNIARLVRVYRVRLNGTPAKTAPALPLPDKPSIAVLPFQNMSADPEQEYFADGMVDEIITALSRFHHLFVIARNSSFTYKGRAVDVKQVGRELGVRYVLEGSVRKAANRVRIIGQLVDAATGAHLWADHFDGGLEDIFDLQDQVTASVVAAIDPKLREVEMDRAKRKPTENLDAYDYVLRGLASAYQWTREGMSEALRLSYKAMEIDPEYALAYSLAAGCYAWRWANGWMSDSAEIAETARVARRAIELGEDDAVALAWGGWALAFVVHELDEAASSIDRAIVLNPNLAFAWNVGGSVSIYLGKPDVGIAHLAHAMRLNPLDRFLFAMEAGLALGHFCAARYEEAASWAEKSLGHRPNYPGALRVAAASNALAGRLQQARKAIGCLREVDPALRVSSLRDVAPLRRPEDLARFEEGLRKAGLPE